MKPRTILTANVTSRGASRGAFLTWRRKGGKEKRHFFVARRLATKKGLVLTSKKGISVIVLRRVLRKKRALRGNFSKHYSCSTKQNKTELNFPPLKIADVLQIVLPPCFYQKVKPNSISSFENHQFSPNRRPPCFYPKIKPSTGAAVAV